MGLLQPDARSLRDELATLVEAHAGHFFGAWSKQTGQPLAWARDAGERSQLEKALVDAATHPEGTEKLWIVGGDQTFTQDGTKGEVVFSPEAEEWAVGGHIVHSHPDGRPLSVEDLTTAARMGSASMTAVHSHGRSTVVPGPDGWGDPKAIKRAYDRAWDKESYVKQSGNAALSAVLRTLARKFGWTYEEAG